MKYEGVLAFKTTDNADRVGATATSQTIVICKYVPYLCSQTSMLELINNIMVGIKQQGFGARTRRC